MMNNSTKDQGEEKNASKKGWSKFGKTIKAFFKKEPTGKQENEIDYYHQYVFPSKIKDLEDIQKRIKESKS